MNPPVHTFSSLYALTMKKKQIVAFFSAITLTQFLMGACMVGIAAGKKGARDELQLPQGLTPLFAAQSMPSIPLQAYNLCIFSRSPRLELAYMSLSLSFGEFFLPFEGLPAQHAAQIQML